MRVFCSKATNVSHSLTNPLSGGSAAIAAEPTRKHGAVQGIRLMSPPIPSMLRVAVAWAAAPPPGRRRGFDAGWVVVGESGGAGGRSAHPPGPSPRLGQPAPP